MKIKIIISILLLTLLLVAFVCYLVWDLIRIPRIMREKWQDGVKQEEFEDEFVCREEMKKIDAVHKFRKPKKEEELSKEESRIFAIQQKWFQWMFKPFVRVGLIALLAVAMGALFVEIALGFKISIFDSAYLEKITLTPLFWCSVGAVVPMILVALIVYVNQYLKRNPFVTKKVIVGLWVEKGIAIVGLMTLLIFLLCFEWIFVISMLY